MSNAPRQPAYHPEIITFIRWVEAASIKGTHDPTAVATRPFMPLSQLDKYLREGNRTKRLLQALFHPGQPPIEPEDVWQNCIIVFSILLLIGKGPFISEFIQHEELWDVKLPFSLRPSRFPPSPDGDRFFDSFFQQQWQFYPHTFRQNVINAQVENERVLPILDKQLLGEGSSAFIYKIKLHPDYDKLRNLGDSRRV